MTAVGSWRAIAGGTLSATTRVGIRRPIRSPAGSYPTMKADTSLDWGSTVKNNMSSYSLISSVSIAEDSIRNGFQGVQLVSPYVMRDDLRTTVRSLYGHEGFAP